MVSNLTLYECLQQVSLQKYHGKFKDRGIFDVGGLLSLTMQDYPTLGISSMADRQNLFYLIQTIKTMQPSSQERQLRSGTRNDGLLQLADSAVKANGIVNLNLLKGNLSLCTGGRGRGETTGTHAIYLGSDLS